RAAYIGLPIAAAVLLAFFAYRNLSGWARARQIGIGLAVAARLLLLFSISWIISLKQEILFGLSGKDIILLAGGMFLIGKSTYEIHEKLEAHEKTDERRGQAAATLSAVIVQIVLIDIIFSLDSVITAVGITNSLSIIIVAILITAAVMLLAAGAISEFVSKHPTLKILALAFLILIGTILVMEGWNHTLAEEVGIKNYVYFAMAFSLAVEFLNIRFRSAQDSPVTLHHQPTLKEIEGEAST
ncbi:MAG: TerC family protein, partial [Chloroflexota bacterium]